MRSSIALKSGLGYESYIAYHVAEFKAAGMKVSGWKNGRFRKGSSIHLGIRVGRENARRFFDPKWTSVLVELDGASVAVNITSGFWKQCPELRSPAIGDWMADRGLVPWNAGNPPKLLLTPTGVRRFRLSLELKT